MRPRSPELMSRADTALLVIDVQSRLLAAIPSHERMVWNIGRLIDGAQIFGIPVAGTEQYPKGLGPTVDPLARRLGDLPSKLMFSCRECDELLDRWRDRGILNVLVAGAETHVCVQQTVLDLLADGMRVFVAVDAVRSRFELDYRTALQRMDASGAVLTTTEAALFEWCEVAGSAEFKQISQLVRQPGPDSE